MGLNVHSLIYFQVVLFNMLSSSLREVSHWNPANQKNKNNNKNNNDNNNNKRERKKIHIKMT